MQSVTIARWAKVFLLAAVALFFTLVVFNNVTDFGSNYEFVRHTLSMDTTFAGNKGMWRAIHSPTVHLVFYLTIIAWETLNMVLCWWGAYLLWKARAADGTGFQRAKAVGMAALASGMLLWFVAFECVGGEWFLMWQSATWNGQEAAFRMFVMEGVVMVLLMMGELG